LHKKARIYFSIIIFIVLLLSGCERNRLASAESIYNRNKYISAIMAYDNFLQYAQNGAYRTEAQLSRSDCYFQLAKTAIQKKNYVLAERLALLANSDEADKLLAEAYYQLGEQAFEENNVDKGWDYFRKIVEVIPSSSYVPEILYRRIRFDLDLTQNYSSGIPNYMELYNHFPDNSYEIMARNILNKFSLNIVADAYAIRDSSSADKALEFLFEFEKYPIGQHKEIYTTISHLYEEKADLDLRFEKYTEARDEYRLAKEYAPGEETRLQSKMEAKAEEFITRGDEMVQYRKFDNAISLYSKAFEIVPEYQPALDKIARTRDTIDAVKYAKQLVDQGIAFENNREYSKALPLYEEAHGLDPLPEYKDRIFVTKNLINAEKNPVEFVSQILKEYKHNVMDRKINEKVAYLKTQYASEDVQVSGWKIMRSTGRNKYEVRYDIFTPSRDFFYVWQVNVKDKSIQSLNKISEELMKE
jgi:tetratricopeptide (TPR) repeat protein